MPHSRRFGLIGYPLSHSFSPTYFAAKFAKLGLHQHSYQAIPLAGLDALPDLLASGMAGLNVTIPYKTQVLPYLDAIDSTAAAIGAVNTIAIDDKGKTTGYNTDAYGFRTSLLRLLDGTHPQRALVLGYGGAARAVLYVLDELGIAATIVSRQPARIQGRPAIAYADLDRAAMASHALVINTTPLGTHPQPDACPDLPYHFIDDRHYCYDLVYNPEKTLFLTKGSARGAATINGLDMLHLQAERSWQIWNQ